jgi:hypothetical protein
MRNSTLPAPANPYAAVTNSDVVISQSFDGGATWSAPVAIAAPADQFMPWGAFDTSGKQQRLLHHTLWSRAGRLLRHGSLTLTAPDLDLYAARRGSLARLVGWSMTLQELAQRMRCSQCGKKAAEVVAVARPRPRGVPH